MVRTNAHQKRPDQRRQTKTAQPVSVSVRRKVRLSPFWRHFMESSATAEKEKTVAGSQLELQAHLKIRPGQLEGFKKQAEECMRVARDVDTRTLRYDWFISSDGTQCEVHEAYVDSEAMIEHSHNIRDARDKLFADFAEDHFMTFYGEVSQELFDMVEAMQKAGHVRVTWFPFFQGLESPASV
jgi:quinol monooxygenase YgiN